MVEGNSLTVSADYEAPSKATDPSRSVKINDKGNLDHFVIAQIAELKNNIDRLVQINDADIYNEYLRFNDIEKFKDIEYKDLEAKDKESFAKKIGGLRFQAKAAKRYIDNMIRDHQCNSGDYPYRTDAINSCGLTMEQMIATTYWASKDKANFKISYVTEQANFLSLVSQLYDMRRGYDVDRGTDKPDILEFPENKVEDKSRCVGGGVNSLSWTLASSHIAYNPKKIELCDIERELFLIYEKVVKDHVEEINNIINVYGEILWASNNKVTGNVRAYLNNIFRTEYLKDFENSFKGYISDGNFYALIEQGLDNIKMPNEIGFRIEKVGFNDIKYAISQGLISLLHLDQYHGYESTLNYLSRLNPQEKLTEKLCDLAIGNSAPSAIATLSFLSRSNLAEEYKNLEVFMVKGASIKLNEIASLTTEELEIIYKTDADNLIEICINNSCHNLFSLYYKKVGLSEQELTKKCANSQLTPLHYAVQHGYTEIISTIVETPGIDQQKLLEIKDKYDHTSLHLAVGSNQIDAVRVILEIPGIDKQKLLEIQDENGYTALHGASIVSQVNAIKVMLNTPKINKQKLLEIQDGNGNTILHLATGRNQVDTIKVIVETPEINTQSLLKIQDKNGYTALHMATGIGLVDAIKAILEAPGRYTSIT